ncbi:1877_t:CDS:2, partial [Gigaspora margarita]
NHKLKEVENYIHFGVESVEYNSITGLTSVGMQMTVLYSSQTIRFQKYLGTLGSNIKLKNIYFVSGLFKFSKSGQNSLSVNSKHQSIIDIVTDDIKSVSAQIPLKCAEFSASSSKLGNISAFESMETLVDASVKTGSCSKEKKKKSHNQLDYIELDDQDNKKAESDFEDKDELEDDA